MVLIGNDNMVADGTEDYVMILNDPLDYNHSQDGYTVRSAERFYYTWSDSGGILALGKQEFIVAYKET